MEWVKTNVLSLDENIHKTHSGFSHSEVFLLLVNRKQFEKSKAYLRAELKWKGTLQCPS